MAASCCAQRRVAQSPSLFIPWRSRATSAAPNATRRRRRSGGLAVLSYGVVVRWPPAVAHSGEWLSRPLSYPLAQPRDERRAERHRRRRRSGGLAVLSYGVVVRWPPAVAHSGEWLSRPLSLSLGAAARRAPRRTPPAVGAGREGLAVLSYGVVVRWPPAVAHSGEWLSRPLSLSLGAAARRAPRRTPPAVGAGREGLAVLSYGVVVRWPPAVAHSGEWLSRPLSLSLGAAARRAPRRTPPAVGAGREDWRC